MCVGRHLYVHMCICMWIVHVLRLMLGILLNHSSTLFIEAGSLIKPRAPQYSWFCQLALGIFYLNLCEAGIAGELL